MEGHCCYFCGGRIRLPKKVLLSTAQRLVKKALKRYEDSLFWHSRLTWDDYSEILITEKGAYEGTNTIIAVADVVAALKGEFKAAPPFDTPRESSTALSVLL